MMQAKQGTSLRQQELLSDYRLAFASRQASLLGRKEVLNGKAKFGIFGDGKELAQLALAKVFQPGDWRSGYYRDQTILLALGAISLKQFFAQLYADTESAHEPASAGRQMNSHFASRFIGTDGSWLKQSACYNIAADLSPTGGQMARLVGLGYASKLYRSSEVLRSWKGSENFSRAGSEVAFGTIGNASTSEGVFWEALNAAGVLQIPLVLSIWDDHYGISVPNEYQTTKGSIYSLLQGFRSEAPGSGFNLYQVKGHEYPTLVATYQQAVQKCRETSMPAIIHVVEMTQPQGHSTSGSHERYKSQERLDWEARHDCLMVMRAWLQSQGCIEEGALAALEEEISGEVKAQMEAAWEDFQAPLRREQEEIGVLWSSLQAEQHEVSASALAKLKTSSTLMRRDLDSMLRQQSFQLPVEGLLAVVAARKRGNEQRYNSFVWNEGVRSPLLQLACDPVFAGEAELVDGRQIIQRYFAKKLRDDPRVFIIGEDVGKLGGVNLEFEGLQEQFGELRITDTGIREATIVGQGTGAALRGLRPIADIQYLDYLIYALQGLADDVASLHYRTFGGQSCPLIIRTKGHRLEGIWHTGSPMGMLINSLRGIHICVPRNCLQAAGMYETLLRGDDPGLVIEVLNGYRLKERCPDNFGEFTVPLGIVEVVHPGSDITVVSYGATLRVIESALAFLEERSISIELIDVQTLLPFDRTSTIAQSLAKTNAVIFCDEDVPGGATAYMMQQVLEGQGAYQFLDAPPRTLTAKPHRAGYGSDGDYYSKPNREDFIELVLAMMHERYPRC